MSNEELVAVMVPRKHLSKIYGVIAQLDANGSTEAPVPALPSESTDDEWTPARLRRAVEESPPAMKDIFRALAESAGQWLTTYQLAKAISNNPDADWKTVAGTLGAFGRRIGSRYGLESLPFEGRYDHAAKSRANRMTPETARIVLQALNNGH